MEFRSGHAINFKFPPMFWKAFIEEPLTIKGLTSSNLYAVLAIKNVEKKKD